MFALLSTVIPPAVTRKLSVIGRCFNTCLIRIAHYADDYAAAVHLRELEDWALRDVGLVRSEIAAAVRGSSAASRPRG